MFLNSLSVRTDMFTFKPRYQTIRYTFTISSFFIDNFHLTWLKKSLNTTLPNLNVRGMLEKSHVVIVISLKIFFGHFKYVKYAEIYIFFHLLSSVSGLEQQNK